LKESGIYAVTTHMAKDGIKAEGGYGELERVLKGTI
jgi:tRNA G26 N,N-dimethylase Trm1